MVGKVHQAVGLGQGAVIVCIPGEKLFGDQDLIEELLPAVVDAGVAAVCWDEGGEVEEAGIVPFVGAVEAAGAEFAATGAEEQKGGLGFRHVKFLFIQWLLDGESNSRLYIALYL